jgi:hypothetical protein
MGTCVIEKGQRQGAALFGVRRGVVRRVPTFASKKHDANVGHPVFDWGKLRSTPDAKALFFFLFFQTGSGSLGGSDDLFLLQGWDEVVVIHFHVERTTALGHGGEVGAVG